MYRMRAAAKQDGVSFTDFLLDNRRLLIFLTLFLCGTCSGVLLFVACKDTVSADLAVMLRVEAVEGGFMKGISMLFSSCFSTLLLLAVLFLCGLSACGAPVTIVLPFFFGLGLGMTEAYYYGVGNMGILFTAIFIIPHYLVAAAALLMSCSESLRMTLLISGQLLPSVHCGGLWQDFKLYCIRFVIFAGIALAAGIIDVCLRLAFLGFFV